jgi:iron complex transport system permease protein
LLLCLVAVAAVALLSISIGTKQIPLSEVWHGLFDYTGTDNDVIVRTLRVPRTVIGISAGAALGLAGALMQALTRNPLADPGILGVNAGASLAVVTAISVLGLTAPEDFVWFAFLGAAVTTALVYALGGRGGGTPVRLALAGTAIQAALLGINQAMQLMDTDALDQMRFWVVGSLANREIEILYQTGPFMLAGAVLALLLARPLNAIALGEDTARSLGARLTLTRTLSVVAVTLLCGAATAACGPIGFVGLMIPHAARMITGPDQKWVLPYSMVLAPVLLLGSDIIGRIVLRPEELQVGIVTSLIGGLAFVLLVRRRKVAQL